ncbi:hypothetical protein OIY81_3185 [Cryptosporidium canis]|uniref:non-specific serine/threonine protein kinase n=1 Tax=Cryptosporidium canis TaxID=195482 RepID=A0ABQ8P4K7_9CRYT|nr:hypothetical protein OIY81_3185 [Cryptosporidium canis]KAJ1608011.1 hypothetical protein OJ252_2659 [Cryptosporidium canis]
MEVEPFGWFERLIFQGAEANYEQRIYQTTLLDRKVVVKHRFEKKYRHPQLDKNLRTSRILRESRNLVRCNQKGIRCPNVHFVDVENGILIMDYVQGTTLNDYLSCLKASSNRLDSELSGKFSAKPLSSNSNLKSPSEVASSVGSAISKLHGQVIHGDLTTSNIIIDRDSQEKDEVVFIDFGLSYSDSLTVEDKAVDLYVLERSLEVTHPELEIAYCTAHPDGNSILNKYKQGKWITTIVYHDIISQPLLHPYTVRARGRKKD